LPIEAFEPLFGKLVTDRPSDDRHDRTARRREPDERRGLVERIDPRSTFDPDLRIDGIDVPEERSDATPLRCGDTPVRGPVTVEVLVGALPLSARQMSSAP